MPDPSRTEVQLCHPNAVIRLGLRAVLADETDIELLAGADAPPLRAAPGGDRRCRVVVADHRQALEWLRPPAPGHAGVRVLVVDDATRGWAIRSALQSGALGYVAVDGPLRELVQAVHSVGRGQRFLCGTASQAMADCFAVGDITTRELDVLRRLGMGLDNKSISRDLDIALSTVKAHVQALLDKLRATSRTGAVISAMRLGLIEVDAQPGRPPGAGARPLTTAGSA